VPYSLQRVMQVRFQTTTIIYKYTRCKGINCVKESLSKQWWKAREILSFITSDKNCLKFQNKNDPLKRRIFEKIKPSICQNARNLHRPSSDKLPTFLLIFTFQRFNCIVYFLQWYILDQVIFKATNTVIRIVFPRLLFPCYIPSSCEVFRSQFHTKYVCIFFSSYVQPVFGPLGRNM